MSLAQSELSLDEKATSPSPSTVDNAQKFPLFDLSEQVSFFSRAYIESNLYYKINQYLAADILPNLRKFLGDNDKVLAVCNNIVYYVVSPALKARTK